MKARLFVIGILLLVCVACHTHTREARRMVKRAEQLADTLPDSTACLIDSVLRMPVYFSERERMDMALLQAEALFGCRNVSRYVSKNKDGDTLEDVSGNVSTLSPIMDDDFFDDHANISTSPDLERAAAYYAKKKQYVKAAHAALYSGFVQQHYDEKEAAMRSFKDAEQYGRHAVDSLTIAQAEYWMGKMLYYEGREKDALNSFMASESFIGNRFAEKATTENSKAVVYILMSQNDSAELCFRKSALYAGKGHSDKVKHKIYNNCSVLYRLEGKYSQAIDCLYRMLDNYNLDKKEIFMSSLNLGNVYFDMKEMDSATKYYQRMETILPTVNIKKETIATAYEALSKFAESQNDASVALQYREKHERVLYDLMIQRQEQTIYRIQQQYDYESLQNNLNQKLARTQRIITLGVVLLLCIVALFLYRSSQRNKKEAEANANLFHFMQQNKALVESNMAQQRKVLDATQQLSELLYAKFKTMQKLSFSIENPKNKIALKDLEKVVFGDGEHWEAVIEVLDALYPGLWESITLKYPKMNEMEHRVLMLSHFKLSRMEEAALLGISTSVLDKLRTKVRKMVEQHKNQ